MAEYIDCLCGDRVPKRHCPQCGSPNEAHSCINDIGVEHTHPEAGDVSICLYCSALMIYTEDSLRDPSREEYLALMRNEEIRRILASLSYLRANGDIPPCHR